MSTHPTSDNAAPVLPVMKKGRTRSLSAVVIGRHLLIRATRPSRRNRRVTEISQRIGQTYPAHVLDHPVQAPRLNRAGRVIPNEHVC